MPKFAHVALNCADIEAAIGYYDRHFGFAVERRLPIGDGKEIVFLKSDSVRLELFGVDGSAGAPENDGLATAGIVRHIAFEVNSVDDQIAAMGDDAKINLGPLDFDAFIPGWRTAWLVDPNGHVVEITQGYTAPA